jgi:hypothetical protein
VMVSSQDQVVKQRVLPETCDPHTASLLVLHTSNFTIGAFPTLKSQL